jgi:hypothetical protein
MPSLAGAARNGHLRRGMKGKVGSARGERVMITILLVAVAAGVACGRAQLNVWALIPATVIYSMITVIQGIFTGLGAGTIILTLFIGATFLQLSYLIACVLFQQQKRPAPAQRRAPAPRLSRLELARAIQSTIGQELRMHYTLPQDLPRELAARVDQLKARYG